MITEDSLAAAHLARIFGSELKRVDEFTTQQASMSGPAVKIDPKQVLFGQQTKHQMAEQERRILEAVQREAEMSYPTEHMQPQPVQAEPQPPPIPQQVVAQQPPPIPQTPTIKTLSVPQATDVWSSIAHSLERIANRLEEIDISVAKRKVRRKK